MMREAIQIDVKRRDRAGKGASRALRRQGDIPAVLYGGKKPPEGLYLEERDVLRLLNTFGAYTRVIDLMIEGKGVQALVRAIQLHPVTDRPLHVDFLRASKETVVRVMVPVHFVNEEACVALKRGGVLNVVRPQLEVQCSPLVIPEHISFDLAKADFGASIRVSQALDVPKGVKILAHGHEEDPVVMAVSGKKAEQEEEETTEA